MNYEIRGAATYKAKAVYQLLFKTSIMVEVPNQLRISSEVVLIKAILLIGKETKYSLIKSVITQNSVKMFKMPKHI